MAIPVTDHLSLGAGQSCLLKESSFTPLINSNPNLPIVPAEFPKNGGVCSIPKEKYANVLRNPNHVKSSSNIGVAPIPMKTVSYVNGIPRIVWTEEEVKRTNTIENLQCAVIGKFSYGWPKLEELRVIIPKQCNIKRDYKIGLLKNRHVLIRLDQQEDIINLMSKKHLLYIY